MQPPPRTQASPSSLSAPSDMGEILQRVQVANVKPGVNAAGIAPLGRWSTPFSEPAEVRPGRGVHEAEFAESLGCGGGDVNPRPLRVAERFVVQPEIQVSVEFSFRFPRRHRGVQHAIRGRQPAQEVVEFGHRNAGVRHDREH